MSGGFTVMQVCLIKGTTLPWLLLKVAESSQSELISRHLQHEFGGKNHVTPRSQFIMHSCAGKTS